MSSQLVLKLAKFERPEMVKEKTYKTYGLNLGIQEGEKMLLSLSRDSYEKEYPSSLAALPGFKRRKR